MEYETEQQIRECWQEVGRAADLFTAVFYQQLFALDAGIRTLFEATDLAAHQAKFAGMISRTIDMFDDPRRLVATLADSGRRHAGYGVIDRHYDVVGQALLAALTSVLGDRFTPELRDAWRETYQLIAAVMRRGAGPSVDRAAPRDAAARG